jgi:hypothetical protein
MNSSGFAWVAAWAFLARATGDDKYARWAREMVDYFASLRNPQTHLLAAHPYDPAYPATLKNRISALRASRTEYMGQITFLSANLLHAADLASGPTGEHFREETLTYIHAFTDRMDVQPDGSFYATFELESGNPLYPRIADAWSSPASLIPSRQTRSASGRFPMRIVLREQSNGTTNQLLFRQ